MEESITFLLIDDDEDDRMLFQAALKSSGENVNLQIAADAKEAYELLSKHREHPPDLAFLDINMPGISGWDCLNAIMSKLKIPEIKIIMYSTSNNPRDVERALEMGACCFCSKPSSFDGLIKLITVCARNFKNDLQTALKENGLCN